jgi:hypothetical protein
MNTLPMTRKELCFSPLMKSGGVVHVWVSALGRTMIIDGSGRTGWPSKHLGNLSETVLFLNSGLQAPSSLYMISLENSHGLNTSTYWFMFPSLDHLF